MEINDVQQDPSPPHPHPPILYDLITLLPQASLFSTVCLMRACLFACVHAYDLP